MQKTKLNILECLHFNGECDRFRIRKFFEENVRPTNSSTLKAHLKVLLESDCIFQKGEFYSITEIGRELLKLLLQVNKILK